MLLEATTKGRACRRGHRTAFFSQATTAEASFPFPSLTPSALFFRGEEATPLAPPPAPSCSCSFSDWRKRFHFFHSGCAASRSSPSLSAHALVASQAGVYISPPVAEASRRKDAARSSFSFHTALLPRPVRQGLPPPLPARALRLAVGALTLPARAAHAPHSLTSLGISMAAPWEKEEGAEFRSSLMERKERGGAESF